MTPRNRSKAPWTGLPEEFAFKVLSALEQEFSVQAALGEFITEGKIFDQEILIRIGYLEKDRIRQINFEASIDYDSEKSDTISDTGIDTFYLCIDALAVWIHEYFAQIEKDEDPTVPALWQATEFKKHTLYFQMSTVNSRLEQMADRLLNETADDRLFHAEEPGDDAFEHALVDPDLTSTQKNDRH